MDILNKICAILAEKGKTQKELCAYLGLSETVFSDWKAGRTLSYQRRLPEIAAFLEVPIGTLTGEQPHPIGFDDFAYAMHNESTSLTDEDKALLLAMARSLASRNRRDEG